MCNAVETRAFVIVNRSRRLICLSAVEGRCAIAAHCHKSRRSTYLSGIYPTMLAAAPLCTTALSVSQLPTPPPVPIFSTNCVPVSRTIRPWQPPHLLVRLIQRAVWPPLLQFSASSSVRRYTCTPVNFSLFPAKTLLA